MKSALFKTEYGPTHPIWEACPLHLTWRTVVRSSTTNNEILRFYSPSSYLHSFYSRCFYGANFLCSEFLLSKFELFKVPRISTFSAVQISHCSYASKLVDCTVLQFILFPWCKFLLLRSSSASKLLIFYGFYSTVSMVQISYCCKVPTPQSFYYPTVFTVSMMQVSYRCTVPSFQNFYYCTFSTVSMMKISYSSRVLTL
jgi:hypothetical protein